MWGASTAVILCKRLWAKRPEVGITRNCLARNVCEVDRVWKASRSPMRTLSEGATFRVFGARGTWLIHTVHYIEHICSLSATVASRTNNPCHSAYHCTVLCCQVHAGTRHMRQVHCVRVGDASLAYHRASISIPATHLTRAPRSPALQSAVCIANDGTEFRIDTSSKSPHVHSHSK